MSGAAKDIVISPTGTSSVGPDEIFAAFETLQRTGRLILTLRGASMAPELWPGDLLQARRLDFSDISLGDIAIFEHQGRLIAHRVIARDGASLHTQGDAAPRLDEPVAPDRFLGVVDLILRNGRMLVPCRRPPAHRRAFAALLRHSGALSKFVQRMRSLRPMAMGATGAPR